jgi:hypothetical protein
VDAFRNVWNTSTQNRAVSLIAGSLVILAGVAVIAVGEILEWGWTRIVGAGLISIAAVYVGALIGWSDPLRPHIATVFSSWSRAILVALTLVMVTPMFIGLLMLVGGMIIGGVSASWYLILAGLLLTLALTAITLATVVLAFSLADRGLWKAGSDTGSTVPEEDAA